MAPKPPWRDRLTFIRLAFWTTILIGLLAFMISAPLQMIIPECLAGWILWVTFLFINSVLARRGKPRPVLEFISRRPVGITLGLLGLVMFVISPAARTFMLACFGSGVLLIVFIFSISLFLPSPRHRSTS